MFFGCPNGTPLLPPWDSGTASTLEEALVAILTGSAAITALVGDRVRPDYLPESDDRPAIAYEVLADLRDHHLKGTIGTAKARVQLAIVGESKADCAAVRKAVANRLDGYRGAIGEVFVIRAKLSDQTDSYDVRDDGSDEAYHITEVEYTIRYSVPIPTHT